MTFSAKITAKYVLLFRNKIEKKTLQNMDGKKYMPLSTILSQKTP
jgi:hypothetical protein